MDNADIRKAIWQELTDNITTVTAIKTGYTPSAEQTKPYLVIDFTGELPNINSPKGMFITFDVLAIGEAGDMLTIDALADSVVSTLHNTDITTSTGNIIRPEYRRDGRFDYWSEALQASVIRTAFWLPVDFWT